MPQYNRKRKLPKKKRSRKGSRPSKKASPNNSPSIMSMLGKALKDALPGIIKTVGTVAMALPTSGTGMAMPGQGSASNLALSAPAASGTIIKATRARQTMTRGGGMRIAHREYLKDIVILPDSEFSLQLSENINPSNGALFPWLASIAPRFESFLFSKFELIYEPSCPSTTPGSVMSVVDYDNLDLAPVSKTAIMGYKDAVRSTTWLPNCFRADPQDLRKQKSYYVGQPPPGADLRLNNVGTAYVATQSVVTTSTNTGELYVDYVVELMTPILKDNTVSLLIQNTYTAGADSLTGAAFSGTLQVSFDEVTPGNVKFNFPDPGIYLILYQNLGPASMASATAAVSAIQGGTVAVASLNSAFNSDYLLYGTNTTGGSSTDQGWIVFAQDSDNLFEIINMQASPASGTQQFGLLFCPVQQAAVSNLFASGVFPKPSRGPTGRALPPLRGRTMKALTQGYQNPYDEYGNKDPFVLKTPHVHPARISSPFSILSTGCSSPADVSGITERMMNASLNPVNINYTPTPPQLPKPVSEPHVQFSGVSREKTLMMSQLRTFINLKTGLKNGNVDPERIRSLLSRLLDGFEPPGFEYVTGRQFDPSSLSCKSHGHLRLPNFSSENVTRLCFCLCPDPDPEIRSRSKSPASKDLDAANCPSEDD